MRKSFTLFVFILLTKASFSQCPFLTDAMVNSCGTSEGNNEFIVFKTTIDATAGSYTLYFGSNNPPTTNPTGILSGANTSVKTGTGTMMTSNACAVNEVTSPTTVIPSGSKVIFIPASFDQQYDITGICDGSAIYVVYIDITALPSKWSPNGNLTNNFSGSRYLQLSHIEFACIDSIRAFQNNWAENADGNFVSWNSNNTVYSNNGCNIIITPIKLMTFTAILSGKNTNLSWKTTNELNAKSFEVQWSTDGVHFTSIGTVAAAGNGSSVKKYAQVHNNLASGTNFYRLKMIDIDGSFSYSQIIKILNRTGNGSIRVFSQLTGNGLNIDWNADHKGKTTAIVFDYSGRTLIEKQLTTVVGFNHYQLPVGKLPAGGYLVKLVNDTETIVTRFSKQ